MKTLIVYSHPNPKSFNKAIVDNIADELKTKGAEYKVKDLYGMNWNPNLSGSDFETMSSGNIPADIKAEQDDVKWADAIVFVFPIWWRQQPAMIKGWVDRVFSFGFAYKVGENGPEGLMGDKKAIVFSTSGNGPDTLPVDSIEDCIADGIFKFCGFKDIEYKNYFSVPYVSDADRKSMLENAKNIVSQKINA